MQTLPKVREKAFGSFFYTSRVFERKRFFENTFFCKRILKNCSSDVISALVESFHISAMVELYFTCVNQPECRWADQQISPCCT